MKRIAILRCLKSNRNCTGAACFDAVNHKKGFFSIYSGEVLEVVAFMSCNGCENYKFSDPAGMREKIERILKIKPDSLHVGMCCWTRASENGKLCKEIEALLTVLKKHNIRVIYGTHN